MEKEINIIFPAKLGDGLTLTPTLKILSENGFNINLFISDYNKIIFENNPYIKELIVLPWFVFKNYRFPVLPKIKSIINLFFYFFKNKKNLSNYFNNETFVINQNIQSYIFGYMISNTKIYYKDAIYSFYKDKKISYIKTDKNKLFSFQILDFLNKTLGQLKYNKKDIKYNVFWEKQNINKILIKIGGNINLNNFIWYNLGGTLKEKEVTEEQNKKYLIKLLKEGVNILLTDNPGNKIKINNLFSLLKEYNIKDKIFVLKEDLTFKEIFTLSGYAKEYYGPDSGLSHLISIKCESNIFYTEKNRVEKIWTPLQNSKIVLSKN